MGGYFTSLLSWCEADYRIWYDSAYSYYVVVGGVCERVF